MSSAVVVALIVGACGVFIQLVLAVYTYGKLSNEVYLHREWLNTLAENQSEFNTRLAHVEGKIGYTP